MERRAQEGGSLRPLLLLLIAAAAARTDDCRFVLADQSDWEGKLGFYVQLENTGAPCRSGTMTLDMGVADGGMWRFLIETPNWQLNHDYTVKAVVSNGRYELWLDGKLLSSAAGDFAPFLASATTPLTSGVIPGWASGATDYLVTQTGLNITSSGGSSMTFDFSDSNRPVPLMLLAPGSPKSAAWTASAADTWTVTATFHLAAYPNTASFVPYIDRYGQSRHADWPGKIRSDSDLTASAAAEAAKLQEWGLPSGLDSYGGLILDSWNEGRGFFRAKQKNGRWWLISPDGGPCFYIGLDTAPTLNWDRTPVTGRLPGFFAELPPNSGLTAFAWGMDSWGQGDGTADVSFNTVNMIRKYGADWQRIETDLTVRRIRTWGFSGFGKWSSDAGGLPILPVLDRAGTPVISRHPDVFDAAVRQTFRDDLMRQVNPRKDDPLVVGWSLGNEYDEIIAATEVTDILGKGSATPSKRALIDQVLANVYSGGIPAMAAAWKVSANTRDDLYAASPAPPDSDIEQMRRFYADAYYKFVYDTVKQIDPNHLYFGFWIVPGWWENEEDWRLIAAHTDVIGYDRYSDQFVDPVLDRLMRESAKPVLVGEFGFPADYGLMRGFRTYGVTARDDAESGLKYAKWLENARSNPFCVGTAWFQYRDEPISGRGPGQGTDLVYGEDFAFGMVDVGDRPKWDLVEQVRTANLQAAAARMTHQAPAINPGGVVNAATFAPGGSAAPGSLISVFGTGLDGASLRVGDINVPVLFTSPLQINAQVPWELAGQAAADLVVLNGNTVGVPLTPYAPGIFAAVPSDGGAAVKRGAYLTIYCTGLGPVDRPVPTGVPGPQKPLSNTLEKPVVTIGGVPAEVSFSGLHPVWIGLYQVNVLVRSDTPTGITVPVVLKMAGITANPVNVAVE